MPRFKTFVFRPALVAAALLSAIALAAAPAAAATHHQDNAAGVAYDVPDGFRFLKDHVHGSTIAAYGAPADAKVPPQSNVNIVTKTLPAGSHFTLQQAAEGGRGATVKAMSGGSAGEITDAKLGDTAAKVYTVECDAPGGTGKLKMRQIVCLAHGQYFVVTTTTSPDGFDAFAELLAPMLASFQFPAPQ